MRRIQLAGFIIAVALAVVLRAGAADQTDGISVIPLPKKIERKEGFFRIGPKTQIATSKEGVVAAEQLASRLRNSTGHPLRIRTSSLNREVKDAINFISDRTGSSSAEAYHLSTSPSGAVIRAANPAGLFYGAQTLLQLFPPEVFSSNAQRQITFGVAAVEIDDEPAFKWRGFLLDVARHFFNSQEIKKVLDVMALQKLNHLQLHLTDDQGWRVEIKQYPELTRIAGWRKHIGFGLEPSSSSAYRSDRQYGGYLSQRDIRELVAYAAKRNIQIVPEIEMPGHASGALSVFPQLSCSGSPYDRDMGGGVFAGVYCAGNEQTYDFLENVLLEVMELFPGEYIHIGGDEVPKANWKGCGKCQALMKREGLKNEQELQSYFIRRMEKFIRSHNRTLIGWSEIREGGLANNALLMDWIGGGLEAAREGHNVVMTPTTFCYLDYYQSTNKSAEPRAIGGYIPLAKVYSFDPIPEGLEPHYRPLILGVQGNLWTEYIASLRHVEYMMLPRLSALAEVTWTPQGARDYSDFKRRLNPLMKRFDLLGVNYREPVPGQDGD